MEVRTGILTAVAAPPTILFAEWELTSISIVLAVFAGITHSFNGLWILGAFFICQPTAVLLTIKDPDFFKVFTSVLSSRRRFKRRSYYKTEGQLYVP